MWKQMWTCLGTMFRYKNKQKTKFYDVQVYKNAENANADCFYGLRSWVLKSYPICTVRRVFTQKVAVWCKYFSRTGRSRQSVPHSHDLCQRECGGRKQRRVASFDNERRFILAAKSLYQVWRRRIRRSFLDSEICWRASADSANVLVGRERQRGREGGRLWEAHQLAATFRRKSHFFAFSARSSTCKWAKIN